MSLTFIRTGSNLTVMLQNRPYSISGNDPIYAEVLALIQNKGTADEVLAVIKRAEQEIAKASQITPNIAIKDGVVTFKGSAVHGSLTERMVKMLEEGFDLVPMAHFLENLMSNPSYRAVTELYSFLEKGKMPITPDGHFMAYKAVRGDYKDIHSGKMDNSIGQVVEMPRNAVDDNRDRTCSSGLHFCSFDYLPHFAHSNGHVMLLKINPRDVVSIPADYNDAKGRACRYEVVGEYEGYYKEGGPFFTSMMYNPDASSTDEDAEDEDQEYSVEDQNGDVVADGFLIVEAALDYIAENCSENEEFSVVDEDGYEVDSAYGGVEDEPKWIVYFDGDSEEFDSEQDARKEAIAKFATGDYSDVTVKDPDGDEIMSMTC